MGVSEERVDYEINLKVAQALIELDKLNASAASLPEVVANVNAAMKKMEVETGLSLGAIEAKFKTVGAAGDAFRAKLLKEYPGMNTDILSPLENAGQPFGEVGAQAGYKATDAARAEEAALTKLQVKDEAAIAAEKNSQIAAEKQLVIEKEKNLALSNAERVAIEQAGAKLSNNLLSKQRVADQAVLEKQNAEGLKLNATQEKLLEKESKRLALLNQEQVALEKQGASLNNQLGLYGQVAKTSSEMMASLRAFSGTKQGQGILTNFFGDYKQASGVTQQIGAIKTAVTDLSRATGASFSQSGQIIKEQFSQIPGIANQTNQAAREMGKEFEDAAKKSVGGINLVRTALHILAASAIFAVIAAFQKMFTMAINGLREMETQTYNLVNAERKLSGQGVEITPKDLDSYIKKLQQLDPMLSKIQATELISSVAIKVAPNLGLKKEDIDVVSQAIAVLAVRNRGLGKSIEEVQSEVENSLLSGRVQGINKLGVKITDQIVEDKAIADRLVANADAYDKLTGKEEAHIKALTIIRILEQNTNEERQHLPEFFKTADAQFGIFQAKLSDFFTKIGTLLAPILIKLFESLSAGLEKTLVWLDENNDSLTMFANLAASLVPIVLKLLGFILKFATAFPIMFQKMAEGMQKTIDKFPGIKKLFDYLAEKGGVSYDTPDIASAPDTPTVPQVPEKIKIDTSDAQKELKDLLKDLENLKDKMNEKEADYQLDLGRFDDDALRDQQRAIEDYNLNVEQAIRAANLAKHDSNAKYHQKELEEERKFEEDMRKLQEDFLYNLEDALRERDARQVLRLIDKYNMDKTALENENALRKKASAEQHASEEADRKAQLDEKLRVMAEEQALKMQRMEEDSALKRARMEEDHAIEMQRLEEQLTERIQQAADKMAEEYGVNAEGAKAIFDLLSEYYGTDGALALLTEQGYNAMLENASGFLTALAGIIGQTQALMSSMSSHPLQPTYPGAGEAPPATPPPSGPFSGYAKGGQFVATRPQKIVVGEGGQPELVQITPMSNIAKGINGKGGISGVNGFDGNNGQTQISVSVDLSPDLEARVVNKAMDGTANVISKIRRGKQ